MAHNGAVPSWYGVGGGGLSNGRLAVLVAVAMLMLYIWQTHTATAWRPRQFESPGSTKFNSSVIGWAGGGPTHKNYYELEDIYRKRNLWSFHTQCKWRPLFDMFFFVLWVLFVFFYIHIWAIPAIGERWRKKFCGSRAKPINYIIYRIFFSLLSNMFSVVVLLCFIRHLHRANGWFLVVGKLIVRLSRANYVRTIGCKANKNIELPIINYDWGDFYQELSFSHWWRKPLWILTFYVPALSVISAIICLSSHTLCRFDLLYTMEL